MGDKKAENKSYPQNDMQGPKETVTAEAPQTPPKNKSPEIKSSI